MAELEAREIRRINAVHMAVDYYSKLAKTRLLLPKRDDVDLAVEIKPDLDELLEVATAFGEFIQHGTIPEPRFVDNAGEAGITKGTGK